MSLVTTRAILLRAFPYGESSTILKFYTEDFGVAGVMARGARARLSRGQGGMETFSQGALTVYHRPNRDLQTLKEFAPTDAHRALAADLTRFAGASVLGEVVLRHAGESANPPLFARLTHALDRLAGSAGQEAVGAFLVEGWGIVDALGYRPELEFCVLCGQPLAEDEMGRFDFASGGVRCQACGEEGVGPRVGGGARAQLTTFLAGEVPDPLMKRRAHLKLLNDFVTYHVAEGRPIKSFGFLMDLVRDSHA